MTEEPGAALRRCIANARVALAISGTGGDVPLIQVNDAFCRLTGYAAEDVVGQNCRLLQGEETSPEAQAALHGFIHDADRVSGRFEVLNYRKDGSSFHNLVFMTRLTDRAGKARFILASQFDMTGATRARLSANDETLSSTMSDLRAAAHHFGLAMASSAQLVADSVATMARLSMEEDGR